MHTGCEVVPSTATKIFLDQKKELGELDKNMNSLFIPCTKDQLLVFIVNNDSLFVNSSLPHLM